MRSKKKWIYKNCFACEGEKHRQLVCSCEVSLRVQITSKSFTVMKPQFNPKLYTKLALNLIKTKLNWNWNYIIVHIRLNIPKFTSMYYCICNQTQDMKHEKKWNKPPPWAEGLSRETPWMPLFCHENKPKQQHSLETATQKAIKESVTVNILTLLVKTSTSKTNLLINHEDHRHDMLETCWIRIEIRPEIVLQVLTHF